MGRKSGKNIPKSAALSLSTGHPPVVSDVLANQ